MPDADPHADAAPQRLFASLGFRFVNRLLGTVLAGGCLLVAVGLTLGWALEGDVTVRAAGVVRPKFRHVVKTGIDGVVQRLAVRDGDHVDEGDILAVLSPREARGRLEQIERELSLSLSRQAVLRAQVEQEQRVLDAVVTARRVDVARAAFALETVRAEQRRQSERALPGWKRRPLEDLVPVRETRASLAQARAQLQVARRQVAASRARLQEVGLEQRRWAGLEQERQAAWRRLEATVVRAPVGGIVLTRDLALREGDHVEVGEALLELAEEGAWIARVGVRQLDRSRVQPGQPVRVFVRSYPHLQYGVIDGSLADVAGQAAGAAGDYPADVDLRDTDLVLADGMAAEVRIAVDSGPLLELAWRRLLGELGRSSLPRLREAG